MNHSESRQRLLTAPFLILILFSAFLFFFKLGDRSFRNPDEGRYAKIAQEMVVSGNWMEPKIYGVDYLKKPPLFYWLTALFFKLFGFNEWAGRSVPALFGLAGVLTTYWFTRKILDPDSALFSGLILASNLWYLEVGRYFVIDAVFSFFVVLSLYAFYLAQHASTHKMFYYVLFYMAVSGSILAKGILGLILPGISIALYLMWTKKMWVTLKEMKLLFGIVIFSVIALPWFVIISIRNPDFLGVFFLHENWSRFASSSFEHHEAWYFYLVLMPAILLPWPLFWRPLNLFFEASKPQDIYRDLKPFLFSTIAGIIFFLSLSKGKLLTYILPTVPFISITIGSAWVLWRKQFEKKVLKFTLSEIIPSIFLIFLGLTTIATAPKIIARFGQELPEGTAIYFQTMGGAILAGGIMTLRALRRRNIVHLFLALIFTMTLFLLTLAPAMEKMNGDYTNKHFALSLKEKLKSGDRIFIYDHPGALYDFGFYLNKPVTLVGLEGELELSRSNPKNSKVAIAHDEFRKLLKGREMIYCLARKSDFLGIDNEVRQNLKIVLEDKRKVLFST